MTIALRNLLLALPARLRLPSLSERVRSGFDDWKAGTNPKTIPVRRVNDEVNRKTQPLMLTSSVRGR
jgi:hypothetical protein